MVRVNHGLVDVAVLPNRPRIPPFGLGLPRIGAWTPSGALYFL